MRRLTLGIVLVLSATLSTACAASARQRKAEAAAKAETGRREIAKHTLTLRNINTGDKVEGLRVVDVTGKGKKKTERLSKAGKKQLVHLLRDARTGKTKSPPERLLWLFYRAGQAFDSSITIISGYRGKARKTSRHSRAWAIDFRVDGVDPKRLWTWCRRQKNTGCGYYPKSGFVHMDVRDSSAAWIDYSGPGEPAKYARSVPPLKPKRTTARQ